jgi:hypothetical protein
MDDHISNLSTGNSSKESNFKISHPKRDPYECGPDFIAAVASILREIINSNKESDIPNQNLVKQFEIFNSKTTPTMTIEQYLNRIIQYTQISQPLLICVVILIDKACENQNFYLTNSNIHKILFVSILINIKYLDDDSYENSFYSKVAGIPLKELNLLEYNFFSLLNFNSHVKKSLYRKYRDYFNEFLKLRRRKDCI